MLYCLFWQGSKSTLDIRQEEVVWWQEGWKATPAPAPSSETKLIPIVTTTKQIDALALAQTYIHRWPAQENVIKDFLLPLGLDINHGFAKAPVANIEAFLATLFNPKDEEDWWGLFLQQLDTI